MERVAELQDDYLSVEAGRLFCLCCREELGTKKSSIAAHVKSAKHQRAKERKSQKEDDE